MSEWVETWKGSIKLSKYVCWPLWKSFVECPKLTKAPQVLRKQLVLNQMFTSVFKSEALTTYENENGNGSGEAGRDEDDDMDDDWFSGRFFSFLLYHPP